LNTFDASVTSSLPVRSIVRGSLVRSKDFAAGTIGTVFGGNTTGDLDLLIEGNICYKKK